jgi:hypothetical protein
MDDNRADEPQKSGAAQSEAVHEGPPVPPAPPWVPTTPSDPLQRPSPVLPIDSSNWVPSPPRPTAPYWVQDSQTWDVAAQNAASRQISPALLATLSTTEPPFHPAPFLHSGVIASSTPTGATRTFAQRLSEQPTEILDAARALFKAIKDEIERQKASTPNDESLTKHNDFVAFLEMIAAGLAQLTDALDRAIDAGTNGSPEPILLGKVGDIARQLGNDVKEGLERNRTYIVDCTIKFGVCAAGFVFLKACGMGEYAAGFLAAIMNLRLPKEGDSTK